MTERSDAEIVAAAVAGDSVAIGDIYDRYADRVYSFCQSRLRNHEQAADATHETFVRAAQRLATLREPSKLRSWLFAIARNQIVDQTRQRERTTSMEAAGEMAADLPGHDSDLLAADAASLLWEAAGSLQERDFSLLELQLRHGLEGADLADALGVSTSHLHTLQSRMKDRIEKALGALLIARHGGDDCEGLQTLLADWDGRYTVAVRSKVTRHVANCDVCQQTKAAVVVPSRFMGVLPLMAAPILLRARTAAAMEAARTGAPGVSVEGSAWTWRDDGFPNVLGPAAAKKGAAFFGFLAAVAFVLIGAGAGGAWYFGGDDQVSVVASGDGDEPAPLVAEPTPTPAAEPTPSATPDPAPSATPTPEPGVDIGPIPTPTPVPPTPVPPPPTPVPPTPVPLTPVPGSIVIGAASVDLGLAAQASLGLSNPGPRGASFSAAATTPFSVSPAAGQVGPGGSQQLVVTVNRSGSPDGVVSGSLTIGTPSGPVTVPVSALVDNNPPQILVVSAAPRVRCGDTVVVTVEAVDTVGPVTVAVGWSGQGGAGGPVGLGGGPQMFTGAAGPFQSNGPVVLTATAADAAGRTASQTITISSYGC